MSASNKISTEGGRDLAQSPFANLSGSGLPSVKGAPLSRPPNPVREAPATKAPNRGRVDIIRETAGRGGKTVTVVAGFVGIGLPEKEELAKKMRAACGCGGVVKDGRIEIQGDQRAKVSEILTKSGFRPVLAGG